MYFDALIQDIQKNNWKVHGLELYENDRLIHHYGNTTDGRFPIYSATKTMVSIAAGIACDRGKFDLEKSVLTYLPSKIIHQMSESQRTAYQAVTIERLMTMSVDGYPFRPEGESYLLSAPGRKDESLSLYEYFRISCGRCPDGSSSGRPVPISQQKPFCTAAYYGAGLSTMSRRLFLRRFRHGNARSRFEPGRHAARS